MSSKSKSTPQIDGAVSPSANTLSNASPTGAIPAHLRNMLTSGILPLATLPHRLRSMRYVSSYGSKENLFSSAASQPVGSANNLADKQSAQPPELVMSTSTAAVFPPRKLSKSSKGEAGIGARVIFRQVWNLVC